VTASNTGRATVPGARTAGITVTRRDVTAGLHHLGIASGDLVFFHSSLKSMGHVEGGPDTVLDGFLDAVGEQGTVVVPAFKLTERIGPFGSWYDHETTPSTVGLITETLRCRVDAVRSHHPTHSVAAAGRLALAVTAPHRAAFGRISPWCDAAFAHNSPFDLLARWDAWYVLLGVSFQVQTIMHYLETMLVDAVLRRATESDRPRLMASVRRWGGEGIWPAPDRTRLGEALCARGVYARSTIGQATVYGARFQSVLLHALRLVMDAPQAWLANEVVTWMGTPLNPARVLAEYTAPDGAPPLMIPAASYSCAGRSRDTQGKPVAQESLG